MKTAANALGIEEHEVWERNVAALKARPDHLDLLPPLPAEPPPLQRVKLLAGKYASLQVLGEDGRRITLHSPRRALEEAQDLVRAAPLGKSPYLVALGLGLGYHLVGLLPSLGEDQHLIIVEKEPEILWAALATVDLSGLWRHPRIIVVVNPDADQVLSHLQARLPRARGKGLSFFGHPPSVRSQQSYYQDVISGLKPWRGAPLRPVGLNKDTLRVLVINPDYFLLPEVCRALRQLGHQVHLSVFNKRQSQGDKILRKLLVEVGEFAPDLVFTINHLGFDREGVLLDSLHRLRIPSVSWYVDSPAIILSLYAGRQSDLAFIFVWDPTYIPEVKALGFERVFPLPLATDPGIFSPERAKGEGNGRQKVTFVGNSMVHPLEKKISRLPDTPEFQELFAGLYQSFARQPFRRLEALLRAEGLENNPLILGLDQQGLTDLEAALLWKGTLEYRLACVRKLLPFGPEIYGDPGWRTLLDQGFRLRPEVNYYDQLPQVYGGSAINFNATSLQMKAAVNQRIFDAPAAGGFVLTDFREQLAELFEVGEEVAVFRDPEEIPDLVRFYLKNPKLRNKITAKARRRVLGEHTYRHRVTAMLEVMRRTL